MQEWHKISLILCGFGFLRDIRPSEPFVTEYILGPWRNVTEQELNQDVYPVSTYGYLAQLILVFLITDFLRYKPLIILMGCCGIIIWSLLLWTTSILALQILEFFYGTYMATEVAYYTYMYAKVDKANYIKVTSYTRVAMLIGKLIASISGQALIYFSLMDYRDLNYITLAAQIMATAWAFFLPGSKTSLYFHRKRETGSMEDGLNEDQNAVGTTDNIKEAFQLLWLHFRNAYTNSMVLQWSLWYIVNLCGYLQVVNYIQVLWKVIDSSPLVVWNGAVDAILTLLGAGLSLAAGYIFTGKTNVRASLLTLAILTIIEGLCLLLTSQTTVLYWSYAGYICFGALFTFTVTVSSSEVSRHLQEESYGLVFGFNTFIALIMQTILTVIVVSKDGFALGVIAQFTVYTFYFLVVGIVYLLVVLVNYAVRYFLPNKKFELSSVDAKSEDIKNSDS